MNVKEMLGTGLAALVFGRSLVLRKNFAELRSSDEEEAGLLRRFEKGVLRRFVGEEVIVFAAVASAYLLAWAASRVF